MATRAYVAAASGVAAASALLARRGTVGDGEARVFRSANHAPDALHPPVWLVMQSGSLGAVFVVGGALHLRGRPRAAVVALAIGSAVWGGVKLVKPLVGRGRPSRYLVDTRVRGSAQAGLGYPSGHAAVSMALALVATDARPGGLRRAAVGVATGTGLARMYVGAHLPLDIVGGWAIGVALGLTARDALVR